MKPIYFLIFLIMSVCAQDNEKTGQYKLRKCCLQTEYFNLQTQSCQPTTQHQNFETVVRLHLIRTNVTEISLSTGRLTKCLETDDCPETGLIINDITHTLLPSGILFENFYGMSYGMSQYCLEMAGTTPQSASLVVALCLHETLAIPKCCPKGQYFDTRSHKCLYYTPNAVVENLVVPPTFVSEEIPVKYNFELQCAYDFPVEYDLLHGINVNDCGSICIRPNHCYSVRKYCIDNSYDGIIMKPTAFVCADNVTKVCCNGEHIDEEYCSCNVLK